VCITASHNYNFPPTISGVTLGGSAGNFVQAATATGLNSTANFGVISAIWIDPNCAGGQTAIAVSGSELFGTEYGLALYEISGLATSPLDQISQNGDDSGGSAITAWTSNATSTTANATEIWIGQAGSAYAVTGPSSGWTNVYPGSGGVGTSTAVAGYQIVAAEGTANYSGTMTSNSYPYAAVVITLQATPPPPPPPDVPQIDPGPWWVRMFKPWMAPRPTQPEATPPTVYVSGSITISPLALSGNGAQTSPDQPQINPGPMWQRLLKPWTWRPAPFVSAQPPPSIAISGSITLAPITLSGTASVPAVVQFSLGLLESGWTVSPQRVKLSHLSTNYVSVPVAVTREGISYNPTSDLAVLAFLPQTTQVPQESDWQTAIWVSNPSNVLYPQSTQCLVGPEGTITLGIGTYCIWLMVTASPEAPVLYCGTVQIT
jgi:hypothetical protein